MLHSGKHKIYKLFNLETEKLSCVLLMNLQMTLRLIVVVLT